MTTFTFNNRGAGVRITRPSTGVEGLAARLDPHAEKALLRLEAALQRGFPMKEAPDADGMKGRAGAEPKGSAEALESRARDLAGMPIWTKRGNDHDLLQQLDKEGEKRTRFIDVLNRLKLTALLYQVRDFIDTNLLSMEFNVTQVLRRTALVDYLVARAVLAEGLTTAEAVFSYVTDRAGGWKQVYDYVVGSALEDILVERRIDRPQGSFEEIAGRLRASGVSLANGVFGPKVDTLLGEHVYNASKQDLVEKTLRDRLRVKVSDTEMTLLLRYVTTSKVPITEENAAYFLPIALNSIRNGTLTLTSAADGDQLAPADYSVSYYEDEASAVEFDRGSVEAAAMMFFTMVWGDELGLFEVVERIAAESATQLQVSVRTRETAEALALYVLDEQFRDLRTGRVCRRVSREERRMFYRQVFGWGDGETGDGAGINAEGRTLWAVLMTEVAKYIGKVEESDNMGASVSPQRIAQAIADLQYNLSSVCSGMAKVAAPIMHGEMDFVIQRILDSEDVKGKLGRSGSSSFWRVVETVRGTQNLTALRNKGVFGHRIISLIAQHGERIVNDGAVFEQFISNVEAYIVAESQLAGEGDTPAWGGEGAPAGGWGMPMPGVPGLQGMPGYRGAEAPADGSVNGSAGQPGNEWNF